MIRSEIDLLLTRIISGILIFTLRDERYIVKPADKYTNYRADILYQEILDDNKYNDWMFMKDTEDILIDSGTWSKDNNEMIKTLDKKIENLKVQLFQGFTNPDNRTKFKKQIANNNKHKQRLLSIRHSLDEYTVEAYAGRIRNEFLIMNTLFYSNDEKVFSTIEYGSDFLSDIALELTKKMPSVGDLRNLARSDSWKSYWTSGNKQNIFGGSSYEWTDEQRAMINISRMYDSVHEHPESPSDAVIEDDDALEGWMIFQKRKTEQEKNKKNIDNKVSSQSRNMEKAGEVFLMASSKEEYEEIMSANSAINRKSIQEKGKFIASRGGAVKEQDIPEVRAAAIDAARAKKGR